MEYQHGGDIYSRSVDLDYSANINPFGMPPRVKEAAVRSLEDSGRYPDSTCGGLCRALAAFHGLEPEMVVCGNGAADLIFGLVLAMKPRLALVTAPAFSEYEQALDSVGCRTEYLYLREEQGFALGEEEFLAALASGPELVFLCNPNNPTGVPIPGERVRAMARFCRERNICLVVDECFCDFLTEGDSCSIIPFLRSYPNVFVLKAFTKLYAMAGLRLGYGLCADLELLEAVSRVRQPWSVSNVAQAAGLAALEERDYVEMSVRRIAYQRQWLSGRLKDMGFIVYNSQANYIFFKDPWEEAGSGSYVPEPGISPHVPESVSSAHVPEPVSGPPGPELVSSPYVPEPVSGPLGPELVSSLHVSEPIIPAPGPEPIIPAPGPEHIPPTPPHPARQQGWLYEALLQQRILIRSCGNYRGLDSSYYRICVRDSEDNRKLAETMAALLSLRKGEPPQPGQSIRKAEQ